MGEFFAIDPVLFRVLFVVLAFTGGSGILIYIIMMLIVPKEEDGGIEIDKEKVKETIKESAETFKKEMKHVHARSAGRKVFGILIILVGFAALLRIIFPEPWFRLDIMGPLFIIFLGLLVLFKN